jgi:hypothetical protein
MPNIITIGREHIPVEQIAYIEPFEPPANGQFRPDRPYKGRVVLLNRETVLTEETPREFAEANEFRFLPEDNVATNPLISFRVKSFAPTDGYNPAKPFQTRLMWRDPNGDYPIECQIEPGDRPSRNGLATRDRQPAHSWLPAIRDLLRETGDEVSLGATTR